jgi:transcriptional regulator with XRE-family HTH domain
VTYVTRPHPDSDRSQSSPGGILRLARESSGLSLGAMARRIHFSKCYLSNVEIGKRKVTPAIIQAYLDVLGDDVNRRQVLLALLSGTASPEVLGRALDFALEVPPLTVDEWHARVEDYGHEYTASLGAAHLQARVAGDLTQLQTHLDDPALAAVAAKLLTLHGLIVQSTNLPPASRWFLLGIRAADRSGDIATRVWTRGRAALSLSYDGLDSDRATDCAHQALALSDRPSVGRLSAQLALAQFDNAKRTFDAVGTDTRINDFSFPLWRMAHITSRLASRLGEERRALQAQETMQSALPSTLPRLSTSLELHRALMMAKRGNRKEGIATRKAFLVGSPRKAAEYPYSFLCGR